MVLRVKVEDKKALSQEEELVIFSDRKMGECNIENNEEKDKKEDKEDKEDERDKKDDKEDNNMTLNGRVIILVPYKENFFFICYN